MLILREIIISAKYDYAYDFDDGFGKVGIYKSVESRKRYYGYIDTSGKIVLPIKYNWTTTFMGDNYPTVVFIGTVRPSKYFGGYSLEGKFGVYRNEKLIIPIKYDKRISFKKDLALVEKNEKFGIYNNMGYLVIDVKYDYISLAYGCAILNKNKK